MISKVNNILPKKSTKYLKVDLGRVKYTPKLHIKMNDQSI